MAGLPASLSLAASALSGQKTEIDFGKAYGFTENLDTGEINYRFTTAELKGPLQRAVTAQGGQWRTWRTVAFVSEAAAQETAAAHSIHRIGPALALGGVRRHAGAPAPEAACIRIRS